MELNIKLPKEVELQFKENLENIFKNEEFKKILINKIGEFVKEYLDRMYSHNRCVENSNLDIPKYIYIELEKRLIDEYVEKNKEDIFSKIDNVELSKLLQTKTAIMLAQSFCDKKNEKNS